MTLHSSRLPLLLGRVTLLAAPGLIALATSSAASLSPAQQGTIPPPPKLHTGAGERPLIAEALAEVSEEVRIYNDHLTILASPWMEGRLPGTRGMELAKEYMEYHFRQYGLEAPYAKDEAGHGTSYRQPFHLRDSAEVTGAHLKLGSGEGTFAHGADQDFTVTSLGSGGHVKGQPVFIGYAIEDGPDDYTSFPEDMDLTGKVAVMLRFEPMNAEGWSRWQAGAERWSRRAGFNGKLKAAADRGAAAVLIINPPSCADPRAGELRPAGGSGRSMLEVPVLHLSVDAGKRLIHGITGGAHTLDELKASADARETAMEFPGQLEVHAEIENVQNMAENVVAVLPGKGRLKDQYVVVGAHLDHLGMGEFGSRDSENAGRKLHPGADDNASGSAGIILIAQKMARDYAAAVEPDLRSVIFIGFSAEESGLNGSDYYVKNPLVPLDQHVLMMNFDMIGRITEKKLSLSGLETGAGLADFVKPIVEATPLTVLANGAPGGASDHTRFENKKIPVLFAIIGEFHSDYHTARDVSTLINRVDAVHAANLFYDIATAVARRPEAFPYKPRGDRPREGAAAIRRRQQVTVRLGVTLMGNSSLEITKVAEGTTAAMAGIQPGDEIIEWNGNPVTDLGAVLADSNPGDKVRITVMRDGAKVVLEEATLQAKDGAPSAAAPAKSPGEEAGAEAKGAGEGAQGDASPRGGSRVRFGIRPDYADEGFGVLVESVTKDSPAEGAGLKAGDRVLTWNGEELDGARGLGEVLRASKPGDEIKVTVDRDGETLTKTVKLEARGNGS